MKNEVAIPKTEIRPTRVCSGGCAYFQPVYESGRKVAGSGTCTRFASEASVNVGITCLWGSPISALTSRVIPLQEVKCQTASA